MTSSRNCLVSHIRPVKDDHFHLFSTYSALESYITAETAWTWMQMVHCARVGHVGNQDGQHYLMGIRRGGSSSSQTGELRGPAAQHLEMQAHVNRYRCGAGRNTCYVSRGMVLSGSSSRQELEWGDKQGGQSHPERGWEKAVYISISIHVYTCIHMYLYVCACVCARLKYSCTYLHICMCVVFVLMCACEWSVYSGGQVTRFLFPKKIINVVHHFTEICCALMNASTVNVFIKSV